MQRQRGFTLIEMLMVIVIITVMMLGAMRMMQSRAQELMVEKTAQKAQVLLNAAMDYYATNNTWPGASSNTAIDDLQTQGFISKATTPQSNPLYAPFGATYSLCPFQMTSAGMPASGTATTLCTSDPDVTSGNIVFTVFFTLTNIQEAVAYQVASYLPNATASCKADKGLYSCQIISYVNPPAMTVQNIQMVQHITTVTPLAWFAPANPGTGSTPCAAGVGSTPGASSATSCWPPGVAAGHKVLVMAPPECPYNSNNSSTAMFRPAIYTSYQGFASPGTGQANLPVISGMYLTPVPRYDSANNLLGWDVYSTALITQGPASTAGYGSYITAIVQCVANNNLGIVTK